MTTTHTIAKIANPASPTTDGCPSITCVVLASNMAGIHLLQDYVEQVCERLGAVLNENGEDILKAFTERLRDFYKSLYDETNGKEAFFHIL